MEWGGSIDSNHSSIHRPTQGHNNQIFKKGQIVKKEVLVKFFKENNNTIGDFSSVITIDDCIGMLMMIVEHVVSSYDDEEQLEVEEYIVESFDKIIKNRWEVMDEL